ncbi:MAG: hypothetical protein D4R82_02325 [Dehalococcoidia bacterium]|nr:MAG: hypothetical protein D4R82_02325 [Dehalococcoidia bacterium]
MSKHYVKKWQLQSGIEDMRIKLKNEQLNILAQRLRFEVMLEGPRDVRGMLDVLGTEMPWDEVGFSKFSNSTQRPARVTFSVETTKDGYICDIHPALAQYIHTLLPSEQVHPVDQS